MKIRIQCPNCLNSKSIDFVVDSNLSCDYCGATLSYLAYGEEEEEFTNLSQKQSERQQKGTVIHESSLAQRLTQTQPEIQLVEESEFSVLDNLAQFNLLDTMLWETDSITASRITTLLQTNPDLGSFIYCFQKVILLQSWYMIEKLHFNKELLQPLQILFHRYFNYYARKNVPSPFQAYDTIILLYLSSLAVGEDTLLQDFIDLFRQDKIPYASAVCILYANSKIYYKVANKAFFFRDSAGARKFASPIPEMKKFVSRLNNIYQKCHAQDFVTSINCHYYISKIMEQTFGHSIASKEKLFKESLSVRLENIEYTALQIYTHMVVPYWIQHWCTIPLSLLQQGIVPLMFTYRSAKQKPVHCDAILGACVLAAIRMFCYMFRCDTHTNIVVHNAAIQKHMQQRFRTLAKEPYLQFISPELRHYLQQYRLTLDDYNYFLKMNSYDMVQNKGSGVELRIKNAMRIALEEDIASHRPVFMDSLSREEILSQFSVPDSQLRSEATTRYAKISSRTPVQQFPILLFFLETVQQVVGNHLTVKLLMHTDFCIYDSTFQTQRRTRILNPRKIDLEPDDDDVDVTMKERTRDKEEETESVSEESELEDNEESESDVESEYEDKSESEDNESEIEEQIRWNHEDLLKLVRSKHTVESSSSMTELKETKQQQENIAQQESNEEFMELLF